jgi:hypothetical protein
MAEVNPTSDARLTSNVPMNILRPICFMVMPYGTKRTDVPTGQGLAEIDFDALWDRAFRPAIESLGYEPVRADQDIGALIIHEMLERLYFSDLVLAEMTIPNGNVYYEVGIRHACRDFGCVLLAADWSRQLFDVVQMRTVRYPLAVGKVDDSAAQLVRDSLLKKIPALVMGQSPVYQVLPGFPTKVDSNRASVMREQLNALAQFQARISAIRVAPAAERDSLIFELLTSYSNAPMPAAVAHALLKLFENLGAWQRIVDLVALLPPELCAQAKVVELVNLARSKLGNHLQAIAALEVLIQDFGATSEREGLLGGRYKKLYTQATGADKARYLNSAIKHYELGMMQDLNDYFPSCNLPRLYRARGLSGDLKKATEVANVVLYACERARRRNLSDEWLRPTLLGAAFDAADVESAESLLAEIEQEGAASWRLDTTIADLELALQYAPDEARRAALAAIVTRLRALP